MLIVDTNVLVAAANQSEEHHEVCSNLLRTEAMLIVPAPVVTETSIMLSRRFGPRAEVQFLEALSQGGLQIAPLDASDYLRATDLMSTYIDLPLGFVDAAVISVAERLETTRIATLNTRDFAVVRPAHAEHLTLLP